MRVFVTGATGFVGSAVVQELLSAGHQVLRLARSAASAKKLEATGAAVLMGSLEDVESLKRGVASADGVIHTGFVHDFANYAASCETDRLAIEAMGAALAGSGRPLVVTTGIGLLSADGGLITEDDLPSSGAAAHPRAASEGITISLAEQGVRACLVRLPPSVHDEGDHGFVPMLINIAREKGVSAYIGAGLNRWPAVHRLDAARLYRLVLENGVAGTRYHGVGEEGVPTREIAELIGNKLGLPVLSRSGEEANEHFGWIGYFYGLDCAASAAKTRELLGWSPVHKALLADLESNYFL